MNTITNAINVIAPYKHHGLWVFDDPRVGPVQETFVAGAEHGFRMICASAPFPGHQFRLDWRSDKPSGLSAKVLLLKDDYTPMEFVVLVLERVFDKDRETATRIMLEIHDKGTGAYGIYPYDGYIRGYCWVVARIQMISMAYEDDISAAGIATASIVTPES
jgi:hypothetical protein